jgi:transcriptional regulator with XRE-family HTH domain
MNIGILYKTFVASPPFPLMPPAVRQSLAKLGTDISIARRKRRLTVAMMLERIGVAKSTYLKLERGDPSVAMGTYAQAFFALGLGTPLATLIDQRHDEQGLLLEVERLPKRIVPVRRPADRP